MADILNSYITTITEADTYFADILGAGVWDDAAEADQIKALKMATKLIDRLSLKGRKYLRDGTQARQFPREYMTSGGWVPDEGAEGIVAVPQAVKDACCEIALKLLEENASDEPTPEQLQQEGVESFSLGELSMKFKAGAKDQYRGLKSAKAYELMKSYMARSYSIR
jgi:hypothetical protein